MLQTIRLFLLVQTVSFFTAALVHTGAVVQGYAHRMAATAESIIGVVLLVGLILSLVWPARTRLFGLIAQAFALLGTLVGLFTISVGIGPQSVPDRVFHAVILIVLAWGLIVTARATPREARA